ncbi:hypothetical protein PKHYL_14700 [Psychrobacter sp. KH172YL61]|nr:hypothetical protein PKHYL_14700 [Psychrobacter sp. KH172YL61]
MVKGSQQLKDELDKARIAYDKASREGDYETMSKLQYETIPQLERRIHESDLAEQKSRLVKVMVSNCYGIRSQTMKSQRWLRPPLVSQSAR